MAIASMAVCCWSADSSALILLSSMSIAYVVKDTFRVPGWLEAIAFTLFGWDEEVMRVLPVAVVIWAN